MSGSMYTKETQILDSPSTFVSIFNFRDRIKANAIWAFGIVKKPEFYKPFRFLIIILGLLELSGFAVLANYSIVLVKVRIISK